MPVILYNIFLFFFKAGTLVFSIFNVKARKWVNGRKNIFERVEKAIEPGQPLIWMHAASLGEFEQGRPLLEKIRSAYPKYKILLTFFSPSGYEAQKNYTGADWIFYLPMDGPRNAKRFLEIVNPALVIFVKYEFWYYYLKKIKYCEIPLILISALFRSDMSFFKWYGSFQRKMLSRFDHLFLQTPESFELIKKIGLEKISSVSGDTRFDRVVEIASQAQTLPLIEKFIGNDRVIVAGSTWPEDEEELEKLYSSGSHRLKWIIAPHEISGKHLQAIKKNFPAALFYSGLQTLTDKGNKSDVLIIDSIGLLSRIYQYATISYVGGGLRPMGVHNVLEAAVYSRPVLFGPYYHKYKEAVELVRSGGGLAFSDPKKNKTMLSELINGLMANEDEYNYCSRVAGNFVRSKQGATQTIIDYIQENRLLTN